MCSFTRVTAEAREDCDLCAVPYVHVGEVLHGQKHLELNIWDLDSLQISAENGARTDRQIRSDGTLCLCAGVFLCDMRTHRDCRLVRWLKWPG